MLLLGECLCFWLPWESRRTRMLLDRSDPGISLGSRLSFSLLLPPRMLCLLEDRIWNCFFFLLYWVIIGLYVVSDAVDILGGFYFELPLFLLFL